MKLENMPRNQVQEVAENEEEGNQPNAVEIGNVENMTQRRNLPLWRAADQEGEVTTRELGSVE
jgi:hypothetical protein